MAAQQLVPFPVVLDLSDARAYNALTLALSEYAGTARADAEEEETRESPNQYRVADRQKDAAAAEQLLADVERQSNEAGKALS